MTRPMSDARVAALYKKYGPAIFARCRRLLTDRAASEDATQEVFFRLVKHLDRAPTSVEALMWIYRIATNHCLNELRNQRRRARPSAPAMLDGSETTSEPSDASEDLLANRDLARRLIERAPEHLRVAAWLYYVDGMSHEEVGLALGLSRRTIINYLGQFQRRATKFVEAQSL